MYLLQNLCEAEGGSHGGTGALVPSLGHPRDLTALGWSCGRQQGRGQQPTLPTLGNLTRGFRPQGPFHPITWDAAFPGRRWKSPLKKVGCTSIGLQKFLWAGHQYKASLLTPPMAGRKCHRLGKQDRATAKIHLHQTQKGLEY